MILEGAEPRLLCGPEIMGVYEPDNFSCDREPSPGGRATLSCVWGGDAQDQAVRFRLSRP